MIDRHPQSPCSLSGARFGPRAAVEEGANPGFDVSADAEGHLVELAFQPPFDCGDTVVAEPPEAVEDFGGLHDRKPRTRKAGKSSEYRIDSPSPWPERTMTRARN